MSNFVCCWAMTAMTSLDFHVSRMQEADYVGQPDEEWAKEARDNYHRDNDSCIVDHFHVLLVGLYVLCNAGAKCL